MGFRYTYYDAAGNGPFGIETDTFEELKTFIEAGIGYDIEGSPVPQDRPEDYAVDLDTGDTVGDGPAPAGVLLPGDAAYQEPDDGSDDAGLHPAAVGSQDVPSAGSVGVQDPAVAGTDPGGSPVPPQPVQAPEDQTAAGVPGAPVNGGVAGTPVYDATVAETGVDPSTPDGDAAAPPADDAADDDGPEAGDGQQLGAPVNGEADTDGTTDDSTPDQGDAEASSFDGDDAAVADDGDDDVSAFDSDDDAPAPAPVDALATDAPVVGEPATPGVYGAAPTS